jgi:stage V sporulation protein AB
MTVLQTCLAVLFGLSSGVIIAGGVFGFIAVIGVMPRMAQKTNTEKNVRFYEEIIILGGACGVAAEVFKPTGTRLFSGVLGGVIGCAAGFAAGVFWGGIAMSLAEMLDVMPIAARRLNIRENMFFFVLFVALGKLVGSLSYFLVPGFFKSDGS